jgi:hypothetical protein
MEGIWGENLGSPEAPLFYSTIEMMSPPSLPTA